LAHWGLCLPSEHGSADQAAATALTHLEHAHEDCR
jgi:hypothetical protein